jgi:RsiW-degrading membrane proteinase PrsW (M82 family)
MHGAWKGFLTGAAAALGAALTQQYLAPKLIASTSGQFGVSVAGGGLIGVLMGWAMHSK